VGLSVGIGLPVIVGIAAVGFFIGKRRGYQKFSEEDAQRTRGGPPSVLGAADKTDNTA